MTPEQWQRVRPILESALELDSANRPAFLDENCPDPSFRREIESLIAAHDQAATEVFNALPVSSFGFGEEARFRLLPGKRVGPYEILEEVALGGMGAVYRAIRADGQYKQRVALKIVRADLRAELTTTRFRNERQILATLDHPNIAKILDGGTTADGLPYFVMEFIDGLPITDYCDRHKLNIDARLNIFRTVCSAVHYAHQRLVIHRDLKPSNILINPEGVSKLLDFGIAKILDRNLLPENATFTVGGQWLMTPEYASPEQFRGEAITTATDVYSLGLVLYELLTGSAAYNFSSLMPHEIARVVLETDPKKPSTAIQRKSMVTEEGEKAPQTTEVISSVRGDSLEKLRKRISGDLDNIVMKAIRKEPGERYSSVDQLSEDIRRHLEHLPVLARKSTLAYRSRKYALRHKVGVAAAALVFLSLLTGVVLTLREARIARANELRAERRFNDVRKLANSLIFEVHDSIRPLAGATTARKLILQRAQEYLDSLAQESKSDPALLRELATAYGRLANLQGDARSINLGETSGSLQNYYKAIELRNQASSLDPQNRELKRELAEDYTNLDLPLFQKGDRNGEKECLRQALLILEPLASSSPGDSHLQWTLARAYELNGSLRFRENHREESLESYGKFLQINERLAALDPNDAQHQVEISFGHKHLGSVFLAEGHLDEALDHYRQALAIDEVQLAAKPDDLNRRYYITYSYDEIGHILGKRGDIEAALSNYYKAQQIRAAMLAADPRDTRARAGLATTYNSVGPLLQRKHDYSGALEALRKALSLRQELAQSDSANERFRFSVAETQSLIGQLYVDRSAGPHLSPEKQISYCREAGRWFESALPIYLRQQLEGKLRIEDAGHLAEVKQSQEQCAKTIDHLGRTHTP